MILIGHNTCRRQRPGNRWARRAACALAAVIAAGCARGVEGPRTETVTIGGERFALELATDLATRTRGLMHRTHIPDDGGMLFVFPRPERRSFWMKNCLTDIDCIFLDPQGRVTATHEMKVEPPRRGNETELAYQNRLKSYGSVFPAQFVIELKAGSIDRLGIEFEQRIDLDLPRLKALAE